MRRSPARLAALVTALAVSACANAPGRPRPQATVRPPPHAPPPVTQRIVRLRAPPPPKCVPDDLGPPPAYPDTDQALRAAGGAADRYQLLAAGRLLRDERLAKLEEVVRKCRQGARPAG